MIFLLISYFGINAGRKWPMTLGAGIGMGMTYTTCENRFRFTYGNNNEQLQVLKYFRYNKAQCISICFHSAPRSAYCVHESSLAPPPYVHAYFRILCTRCCGRCDKFCFVVHT